MHTFNPAQQRKPLDIGNGHLTASVTEHGALACLAAASTACGMAVLEPDAGFADAQRGDPAAVRAYRTGLVHSGGLGFGADWQVHRVSQDAGAVTSLLTQGELSATVTTVAPLGLEAGALLQWWRLRGPAGVLEWGGPAHLRRATLTQLTEGGVLDAGDPGLDVVCEPGGVLLDAPGIQASVWIAGLDDAAWDGNRLRAPVRVAEGGSEFVLRIGMATTPALARAAAQSLKAPAVVLAGDAAAHDSRRAGPRPPAAVAGVAEHAANYLRRCCALPVGDTVCLITDHRILPLVWTRDAYYAASALAQCDADGHRLVDGHLRWLFQVAQRPEAVWCRSYLPNGVIKDRAFQLDQQCYPWLELAEHAASTGDGNLLDRFLPGLEATLAALERRRAPGTALFASEETPGDDPLSLPYHTSSHILLWRTLRRLGDAAGREDLRSLAQEVRADVLTRLVTADEAPLLAYCADLADARERYHDANDLPTALAPVWGFCEADDPVWQATMRFAFSPANPGYASGPEGGLGSRHTPGAWPLGDIQELVWADQTGQRARAGTVLDRIARNAQWDGALPEARDPDNGSVRSRHWFAWPGAALLLAVGQWVRPGRA